MSSEAKSITFFQKYLSVWILLSMVVGVILGYYVPGLAHALESATLASVSIPIALLLCKIRFSDIIRGHDPANDDSNRFQECFRDVEGSCANYSKLSFNIRHCSVY